MANLLLQSLMHRPATARPGLLAERTIATQLCLADVAILGLLVVASRLADPGGTSLVTLGAGFATLIACKGLFGLYPGHGLPPHQRLRQGVLAVAAGTALAASLALAGLAVQSARPGLDLLPLGPILAGAVLLIVSDPLVRWFLIRAGRWKQPVFIFGGGKAATEVVRQLHSYPDLGFQPVGIVDDSSVYIPDEEQGVPVLRTKELSSYAPTLARTTTALVVEPAVDRGFLLAVQAEGLFDRVLLVPQSSDLLSLKSSVRQVGATLAIELTNGSPSRATVVAKRMVDVAGSAAALVLLAPLLAIIALMIRLDSPGPVLFAQRRWAGHDRGFTALKFRTMYVDGERRLKRLFLMEPDAERDYARYRKLSEDPRVTRIGGFLRSTSLDELPQLFNVLRGEMSLVGPRPYTIEEINRLGPAADLLHLVKPGLTGFWQVSGRNRRTFRERIEMDCYYVRNLSLWLDIWIIGRTVLCIVKRDGK